MQLTTPNTFRKLDSDEQKSALAIKESKDIGIEKLGFRSSCLFEVPTEVSRNPSSAEFYFLVLLISDENKYRVIRSNVAYHLCMMLSQKN